MTADADVGRYPPIAAPSIELQTLESSRHHVSHHATSCFEKSYDRSAGEELAKSAEIGRSLAHFGTPAEATIEHSQSHGALAFMATEHGTGSRRGGFFGA